MLNLDESAEAGQQEFHGVLWDVVFKRKEDGTTEPLAFVQSPDLAEFIADALNKLKGSPDTVVHILHQGWPLCGFSNKVPGEWPPGHKWVQRGDPRATCTFCRGIDRRPPEPEKKD